MASKTADLVIALNVTRCTSACPNACCFFSSSKTCQAIASPSRSGSVARIIESAVFAADKIAVRCFFDWLDISQLIEKPSSGFTDPVSSDKSLICP